MLSAYGGPGSLVHTQYGSIIISCIEEWGFLKRVLEIHKEFVERPTPEEEMYKKVSDDARRERNGNIRLSNDNRLLESLQLVKNLPNLKYLVLIPDIDLVTHSNKIKNEGEKIAILSSYMPKVFSDGKNTYKSYSKWYKEWTDRRNSDGDKIDSNGKQFHPPKYVFNEEKGWIGD